ncbi:MAG TPA: 16S rRNA (guanine(527)-N(7))-methyltransferase RsmG [Terriglobales bacterium]|nr:16S rRNA (guanine(527)-N(7))-methyltransferase RsmG [Terriglobales bacterium]
MNTEQIAELLRPFLGAAGLPAEAELSPVQLNYISIYVDLLERWNTHVNLTAVRDPETVVTRHFGESLFLAAYLFPHPPHPGETPGEVSFQQHAVDLGSGAGFPGLPLKIYAPELRLTLVESNRRKAAFLGEVIRTLGLSGSSVFSGRLDERLITKGSSSKPLGIEPVNLVTMRAVEHFEAALETAAALVRSSGAERGSQRLALLIGMRQAEQVPRLAPDFSWDPTLLVPQSRERVLLVGGYPSR